MENTEKKYYDYGCKNGAFHTYECCFTCWNSHPNAKPNDYFYNTNTLPRQIRDHEIKEDFQKANFTPEQAFFLKKWVIK